MPEVAQDVGPPQLVHDLAEVIGDETVVLRDRVRADLRDLPAWKIGVDAVDERFDLEERRQWLEEVVILLVRELPLDVQVADQHDRGEGQDLLLPSAELPIL